MIRSSVQALHAYVPGEQPRARRLVKLNTNENPYPPSPRVARALARFDVEDLRRYPDPMCNGLRTRIARLHGCTPEQVFVGNGSDEVLALCVRAFVERDEAVGFFAPSYSLYPVLAAIEDVRTKPVELADDFSWRMPADYQAALFCLTQPNAPTSRPFPRSRIAAFCRRFTGVVLVDEAYGDFADEHFVDLALRRPNVVVARSFSKSYSLAGLRLGYAVGPAPLIAALHKIKDSYNVSRLAQLLGEAALDDQRWMRRNVAKVVATRTRTAEALRRRGWTVADSATNFLWARPVGRPAAELFEALRARGIFVRYFPGPRTGDYLRITIGTDAQMKVLLAELDRLARL
jgi:histidinol-phosphate aminotransferase